MAYCAFAIFMTIGALQSGAGPVASRASTLPRVAIVLPPKVASQRVQIRYLLIGPFGGYGGFVREEENVHSYEIETSVKGKPASQIKIVVYAPGCRFQLFKFPMYKETDLKVKFACLPLPSVTLSGQIPPDEMVQNRRAELVISYTAYWMCDLFGLMDCLITEFDVTSVVPNANGEFQVELPDFAVDPTPSSFKGGATLRLGLRDPDSWNSIVDQFEPVEPELQSEMHDLRILSSYPRGLRFAVSDRKSDLNSPM